MKIFVACYDASGIPSLPSFDIETTESSVDSGYHYDEAIAAARDNGYSGPFIAFDNTEYSAITKAAAEIPLSAE